MAVEKIIELDGKEYKFKASAMIPRLYRMKFKRDIFKDMQNLTTKVEESLEDGSSLDINSLELFENIAFIMVLHGDNGIPDDIEHWLDGLETFSIYTILPQILELWGENLMTLSEPKKNKVAPKD